jgi:hypothetical protein
MSEGTFKRRRRMVAVYYPVWYCSHCMRSVREDRAHIDREKDITIVSCPWCGSSLGGRSR